MAGPDRVKPIGIDRLVSRHKGLSWSAEIRLNPVEARIQSRGRLRKIEGLFACESEE
jgi:hypothetical protein